MAKSKLRYIFVLPLLVMVASASAKLLQAPQIQKDFEKIGAGDLMLPLGILQLVLVALFLVPKTRKLGFLFICSYCGGIIATRLLNGEALGPGLLIGFFMWVAMWFEDRSMFLSRA
ncbi:MAG: hypothetical protein AAGD10_16400 [Myxococcota bacterium]